MPLHKVVRRVFIFLMQHGEQDDTNTAFELAQVAASIALHLDSAKLDAIYHSERERARQAAVHAATILKYSRSPTPHETFFVDPFFESESGIGLKTATDIISKDGTIKQLLQHWPAGETARHQVHDGLIEIAEELAIHDPDQEEYYVLIGYHGPLTGIAAVDPSTMPANHDVADMVCYELSDSSGDWTIVASVLLKCPLVKTA